MNADENTSHSSKEIALSQVKLPEHVYIDTLAMSLVCGKRTSLPLTLREFQILSVFLSSTNFVATRHDFRKRVWRGITTTQHTLDVHIFHIRKKIAHAGAAIVYRAPDGFALSLPPQDS